MTDDEIKAWVADLVETEKMTARHQLRKEVNRVRRELGLPSREAEAMQRIARMAREASLVAVTAVAQITHSLADIEARRRRDDFVLSGVGLYSLGGPS